MAINNATNIRRLADSVGIIGSATCAAHCLLLPAMLVAGSSIPPVLVDERTFHLLLTFLVIPSALFAFTLGCRRHRDRWVFVLGTTGLAAIIAAAVAGHDLLGHVGERILMIAASCLLVTAHIRNYRLCRRSLCQHSHDD